MSINIKEVKSKIDDIKKDWIEAKRSGDTAVGYTLEEKLGIGENNSSAGDLIDAELKAFRKGSNSNNTFMSLAPKPRGSNPKIVKKYGKKTNEHEKAIYTAYSFKPNSCGLYFKEENEAFNLHHENDGYIEAGWKIYDILKAKNKKMINDTILYVAADSKKENGKEYFRYTDIYLVQWSNEKFLNAIRSGEIIIEPRMHFAGKKVRDRGTAFRMLNRAVSSMVRMSVS